MSNRSHSHHHHHLHHHGDSHGHDGRHFEASLRWVFFLNLGFAIFELIGGYFANSIAVMSDALHDFGDAAALGMAWILEKKAGSRATSAYTYGYRRWSLLSSLLTGSILLVGSSVILHESIGRLQNPEPVVGWGMLTMAIVGISVNGWSLLRFSKQGGASERMIRLHLIEDVAGWLIVLAAGLILQVVDWYWLDALAGIGLSLWVIWNVIRQLVGVAAIFLQAGPIGISVEEIENRMTTDARVLDCHHTHLWSLDGEKHILTTHLRLRSGLEIQDIIDLKLTAKEILFKEFDIFEATIEFEFEGEACHIPPH